MTLTTTPKIMTTNDIDMDVKIEINKEFALKMTIGSVNYSVVEAFFEHSGHVTPSNTNGWYRRSGAYGSFRNYHLYLVSP
jgi:hypothetical protein